MRRYTTRSGRNLARLVRAGLLVVLAAALGATPVDAALLREGAEGPDGIRAWYERVATAWEDSDPDALVELVHPDGLQVRLGAGGRSAAYSPSQAYYFFKSLFRTNQTVSFAYQRQQQARGPRVHAMALWRFRKNARAVPTERRLVLVLARAEDRWLLTEINAVR